METRHHKQSGKWLIFAFFLGFTLLVSGLVLISEVGAQGSNRTDIEIDHSTTGFPLSGGHAQVVCERCHMQGIFRGTPTQCMQCHSPGGRVVSTYKPTNHLPTTLNCNSCHRTTSWTPAFFTHNGIVPGTCSKCHNQTTAVGKPAAHIPTTLACDSCHRTTSWTGAVFTHKGVALGACLTCHNGTTARGKPANHLPTTQACELCHRSTTTFLDAQFSHTGVVPGTCLTCHNGTIAQGKPNGHPTTTLSCDASGCHTTRTFSK